MAKELKVGLIGFGTIGTGAVKLIQRNRSQIRSRLGFGLRLSKIADLDLRTDRGVKLPVGTLTNKVEEVLDNPEIDIVIELMGGYEPARSFVLRAIRNGKSVVTANKALLAVHGAEIARACEKAEVDLGYEASVGGGIPIIRTLREGLAADRNQAVYGIVNGTCNYILTKMDEEGGEFGDVLEGAQRDGLAEADPTFDIDGIDAAHKLTLLIQLAFGVAIPFKKIPVEGIRRVSQVDISFARDFGYAIKLLAIAKQGRDGLEARVHPAMVPRKHLLADVGGALNAIAVQSDALGASMYFGLGAGMMPTATAVVADVIEAARNIGCGSQGRVAPFGYPLADQKPGRLKLLGDLKSEYYLRFDVRDRPGVLAKLSSVLGEREISIASVIQPERQKRSSVPIVIRTHQSRGRDLQTALRSIARLADVKERPVAIRIEDSLGA